MPDLKYPQIYSDTSSQVDKDTLVSDGIVIYRNFTGSEIDFTQWPWESDPNNFKNGTSHIMGFPIDTLRGKTKSVADGLIANVYDYPGRYLSMIVGDVQKKVEFPVSFSFNVKGQKDDYVIRFVHGPLDIKGWHGNIYYETINSNESKLVDLKNLLESRGDEYILTNAIVIALPKDSALDYMEYAVSLGKYTETPPSRAGEGTFVKGTLVDDIYSQEASKNLFHDFSLWQLVELRFENVPVDSKLSANGWEISEIKDIKNRPADNTTDIMVTAKKKIELYNAGPFFLMNLDIWDSLSNLGPKDFLFLAILAVLFYLLFSHRYKTRNILIRNGNFR